FISIPSRSKTKNKLEKTRADPASGCKITRTVGIPIIRNILDIEGIFFISNWIELRLEATNRAVVIFANSEGWRLKLPTKYQEVAAEIF